jgi:hypothetical protein
MKVKVLSCYVMFLAVLAIHSGLSLGQSRAETRLVKLRFEFGSLPRRPKVDPVPHRWTATVLAWLVEPLHQ